MFGVSDAKTKLSIGANRSSRLPGMTPRKIANRSNAARILKIASGTRARTAEACVCA